MTDHPDCPHCLCRRDDGAPCGTVNRAAPFYPLVVLIDGFDPSPEGTDERCGTLAGYSLHRRLRTPICRPCYDARRVYVGRYKAAHTPSTEESVLSTGATPYHPRTIVS